MPVSIVALLRKCNNVVLFIVTAVLTLLSQGNLTYVTVCSVLETIRQKGRMGIVRENEFILTVTHVQSIGHSVIMHFRKLCYQLLRKKALPSDITYS
jgi:hypothetical protein